MRIPRIYVVHTLSEGVIVELAAAPSHHLAKVLRMQPGRELIVFNGQGGEYQARIHSVQKKSISIIIDSYLDCDRESPIAIELGVCLIKNDRFDWLLQKATELGVSAISPLISDYTDIKLNQERLAKKIQHWQQVIINACEQSGRTYVPELAPPQPLSTWVENVDAPIKTVLHPYPQSIDKPDNKTTVHPKCAALLVGPEGGLSDAEIADAINHCFIPMTIGPRILRAETAPLAALTLMQARWGDIAF